MAKESLLKLSRGRILYLVSQCCHSGLWGFVGPEESWVEMDVFAQSVDGGFWFHFGALHLKSSPAFLGPSLDQLQHFSRVPVS